LDLFAGPATEDFSVLKAMASSAEEYGCKAIFTLPSLSSESLAASITSLSRSLSTTKTELTATSGKSQRTVKEVRREKVNAPDELTLSNEWKVFDYELESPRGTRSVKTTLASAGELQDRVEWHEAMTEPYMLTQSQWVSMDAMDERARGIALRIPIAGEGAERIVHKCREVDEHGTFVGPKMVAKESRFVEDATLKEQFHVAFAKTQAKASELANHFNAALSALEKSGALPSGTPRMEFLPVCVYLMHSHQRPPEEYGFLVEKQLVGKWQKCNSNNGWVSGREAEAGAAQEESEPTLAAPTGPLDAIDEGEVLEVWSDDEAIEEELEQVVRWPSSWETSRCQIVVDSVPQAFSHFTWQHSKHRLVVCDLQGVYNAESSKFELTDPAIHYRSKHKRDGHKYGATDKGETGMDKFFETHVCTDLCRALKLETPKKGKKGRNKALFPMPTRPPKAASPRPWEDDRL
jgi:hypothetical protein